MSVPKDYESLLCEYQAIKQDNEQLKQCVHEQKRQLNVLQALSREYEQEIELMQQKEKEGDDKWAVQIGQLEEKLLAVKLETNERIGKLEEEVLERDCTISALQKRIGEFERAEIVQTSTEDCVKLLGEILDLKNENQALKSANADCLESVDELKSQTADLTETLALRQRDIDELTQALDCKRSDLIEARKLIADLNDTVCQLRSELDALRSNDQTHRNQGNSLFAEVDDRRVYLQQTIKDMKASYVQMQKERTLHVNEIARLKAENHVLCDQWRRDLDERHEDDVMILNAFKDRISTLENLLKIHQSKPDMADAKGHFQLSRMIDRYKKQIADLESNLSRYSLNSFCMKQEFAKMNAEKRRWHVEALQSRMRLDLLRSRLKSRPELEGDGDIWSVFSKEMLVKDEDTAIGEESHREGERAQTPTDDVKDKEEESKERATEIIEEKPVPVKSILKPVSQENVIDLTMGDDDKDGNSDVICVYEDEVPEGDEENRAPKNQCKPRKNVNFSETTVDSKTTNRSRLQRGKIIVPNVVINQK